MNKQNTCSYCSRQYKLKKSLNSHLRQVHSVDPESSRKRNIICSKCNESFFYREDIRKHYLAKHEISVEIEEKKFKSLEDFKVWKQNMEMLTKSSYVKNKNYKNSSGCTVSYYTCHKSGTYEPKGSGIRKLKSSGVNKIGTFCPAYLNVIISPKSGNVDVIFWKTHLGHDFKISHLSLSETEKTDNADIDMKFHPVVVNLECETTKEKNSIETSSEINDFVQPSISFVTSLSKQSRREENGQRRKRRKMNQLEDALKIFSETTEKIIKFQEDVERAAEEKREAFRNKIIQQNQTMINLMKSLINQ